MAKQKIIQIKWLKIQIYYCIMEKRENKESDEPDSRAGARLLWQPYSLGAECVLRFTSVAAKRVPPALSNPLEGFCFIGHTFYKAKKEPPTSLMQGSPMP